MLLVAPGRVYARPGADGGMITFQFQIDPSSTMGWSVMCSSIIGSMVWFGSSMTGSIV